MAVVFRGENLLDKSIIRALKVVRPELTAKPEFVQRFAEEARILERLQHRNVVRFYGVRRDRGLLVMELELLEGAPLSKVLKHSKGRQVPLRTAVGWIARASEGVAAAHELGIVHRDLKPENLFLTDAGEIKVLDFGIARAIDDADRMNRATVAGTVPGSPAYMAPEVCEGAIPAGSADVYALAMTLYELLLGYHPLLGPGQASKSSTQLMMAQVAQEIPPLRSLRPDTPKELEDVLQRGLAKKPEQRYKTARDLADALEPLLASPTEPDDASPTVGTRFALPTFASGTPSATKPTLNTHPVTQARGGLRKPLLIAAALVVPIVAVVALKLSNRSTSPSHVSSSKPDVVAPADASPPPADARPLNEWVRIEPPKAKLVLGLPSGAPADQKGFRASRNVTAPSTAFLIQQHEVTWAEIDPWIGEHHPEGFKYPTWAQNKDQRSALPATGLTWIQARQYCKSIGASLPSEEQWEYAARGPELRANPWGEGRIDLINTHAFAGSGAVPSAVGVSDQDHALGDGEHSVWDMAGNVQEWTEDLWREDSPPKDPDDEAWVQRGPTTFRAIRGLPLYEDAPTRLPRATAAYRDVLCGTGVCVEKTRASTLSYVGFRCAKSAADMRRQSQ